MLDHGIVSVNKWFCYCMHDTVMVCVYMNIIIQSVLMVAQIVIRNGVFIHAGVEIVV